MTTQAPESGQRILIIDDQPANVRLLERWLADDGYRAVRPVTDPREAEAAFVAFAPDLVLLDLLMRPIDGLTVLSRLRPHVPEGAFLPVLVLTADGTPEARHRALDAGATDFLTKPLDALEVRLRIRNLLRTRALYLDLQRQKAGLEETIRQRTQELLRAQRLESVGALAAGIAHDLNNMLTPISMGVGMLRQMVTDDVGVPLLETMRLSVDHGGGLVRQLLTFVRGPADRPRDLHLPALLKEVAAFIGKTFPRSIEVIADVVASDLPAVRIDVTQMYQVLMNLAINARDAMPDGGTLTLSAEAQQADATFAEMEPAARPGSYVVIGVADTGVGIAPELQERIFEPLFTTKGDKEGTGLGLSTTARIVRDAGGFIRLTSAVGRGTQFRVYLPASEASPISAEPADEAPEGAGERVLIVEDEGSIREVMRSTLEASNYRVLAASNAVEAIALLASDPEPVAAAVVDLMAPGLHGSAAVAALSRVRAGLRVVAMSGDQSALDAAEGARARLRKPFSLGQLLRLLRSVVAEEG